MTEDKGERPSPRLFGRNAPTMLAGLTAAFAVPFGVLIYAVIADRPEVADAVAPWLMPLGIGLLLTLALMAVFSKP